MRRDYDRRHCRIEPSNFERRRPPPDSQPHRAVAQMHQYNRKRTFLDAVSNVPRDRHASLSPGQRCKHGRRRRREVVAGRFRYRWQVTAIEAGSWPRSVARHFREVVRATLLIVLICGAVTLLSAGRLNAQVFDVTNGNSSGPGSLAQAVSDANASGAAAIIRIDVPAVSLAREVELLNAMKWTTTVGSSQITLPLSSGYPDIVSFGPNALQFTVGNGVTLKTDAIGIEVNNSGMTVSVNGTVLTGGTANGVRITESGNIIVGPGGTIHSVGTAIVKLGGNLGHVQIYIAPGGSVISDTQAAITVETGTYGVIVAGLLSGPVAVAGSVGPNSLELRPGFQ